MENIRKLRESTGAKIIDCKAALDRNNGDYGAALKELLGNMDKVVEKKADRDTKEGVVVSYIHPNKKLGIILELFCETDFVARNEEFNELAKNLAMHFVASPDDLNSYIKDPSKSIEDLINEYIAKLGENIVLGRYTRYELGAEPCISKTFFGNYWGTKKDYVINDIVANQKTVNGRTYSRECLENLVSQIEDRIKNEKCFIFHGEDRSETIGEKNLSLIAAKVKKVNIEDDKIKINFTTLNTPFGTLMKQNLENIKILPSMIGSVDKDGNVSSDVKFIGFDFSAGELNA